MMGRPADAIPVFEAGIESWLQAMGDQGSYLPEARQDLGRARADVGRTLLAAGALDEAETHLLAAHELLEALADPDLTAVRQDLARLYRALDRPEDAARFAGLPR